MDFEIVLFDTAPTGHTLRLLQFPSVIEKGLGKFLALKSQFLPMFSQITPMFGFNDISMEDTSNKLEETLQIVRQINGEFKNPVCEFKKIFEIIRRVKTFKLYSKPLGC
jgi:arsenite/tail-anchored protein-transporting ATPase